jgi:hypothetical protein
MIVERAGRIAIRCACSGQCPIQRNVGFAEARDEQQAILHLF